MAYIRFLKPDQPSQKKNYQPPGVKYKKKLRIFQIISIIEALGIIALIYTTYLKH